MCALISEAHGQSQFSAELNNELSNDEIMFIEFYGPQTEKIIAVRYKLDALDDPEFKDQMKHAKLSYNKNNTSFFIDRKFLSSGSYILEIELDHRRKRVFEWLKYFELGSTQKIYLKFNLVNSPGESKD